jgi:hypothetical protein
MIKEKCMNNLVRTSLTVLVMILVGLLVLSCSSPNNNNGVSQNDVSAAFTGFSTGASQVSTSTPSIQTGPPLWTYTYVFTQSAGGSITFVLQSTADLNATPTTGESGNFNGSYMTFTNFSSGNGYFINGTISIKGGFTVAAVTSGPYAGTGDLLLSMNYSYSGSCNITGNVSFGMSCNYSMSLSEYVTAAGYGVAVASGPTLTGTVSANGQTYNVGSLSANVAPMNLGRMIFAKK